ncbi:MAG TPA: glutamine amidotransferase [Candidatus Binataceae bacterium]|nr:glutamine amidotransferase [Candidatus Binataceae bacterium]
MKSAIAIRHVPFEDLGNLAPVLAAHGLASRYLDCGLDEIDGRAAREADLLVILGGPIGAYEDNLYPVLGEELHVLERRLAEGRPTLGICLGAQLIARALGAKVYSGAHKEIGWSALELSAAGKASALRHLQDVEVLHWHGDTFDLPAQAVALASTPVTPNQAFAWGAATLALQFHLEVTAAGLERWFIGHACEISATAGVNLAALRAQSRGCSDKLQGPAHRVLDEWLKRVLAP